MANALEMYKQKVNGKLASYKNSVFPRAVSGSIATSLGAVTGGIAAGVTGSDLPEMIGGAVALAAGLMQKSPEMLLFGAGLLAPSLHDMAEDMAAEFFAD